MRSMRNIIIKKVQHVTNVHYREIWPEKNKNIKQQLTTTKLQMLPPPTRKQKKTTWSWLIIVLAK